MSDIAAPPEGLDEFLAEPLAPQAAQLANASPTPSVDDTPAGLDEFIAPEMNEEKYGTPTEMAKTAVEGLGKGIAGPLFTGAETAVLGNANEQRARAEANPVTHGLGEVTGLVGGAMTGTGLGGALGKVGEAAEVGTQALGIGKLGSSVVKGAIENLVYQTGDEASKLILRDPGQSAETAVADMGLAALIGGAVGTISPLWQAASGTKTAQLLKSMANKMGGIEGVVPDAIEDSIAKTGMDIKPEIKAGLASDPHIQQMFKTLQQSDTTASGLEFQKSFNEFRNKAGEAIAGAFDKSPEEISSIGEVSKYEAGKQIGRKLADEYETQLDPIAKTFDDLKSRFKNVELPQSLETDAGKIPGTIDKVTNQIAEKAIEEGWTASPSSDIMREVSRVTRELPLQKTLKNLGDFITQVGNNTSADVTNGPLRRAGGILKSILKEAEADAIAEKLGVTEGPLAVADFKAARAAYATQSALKEAIDSRLHAGGSTSGFAKFIREMAQTDGESVLRRLSGAGDANLLSFLQDNYPQTAKLIKDFHTYDLLKAAADKAKPGMLLNNEVFLNKFNKMSPELKSFIASPEAMGKIQAIEHLVEEFNKLPHNFSNTARTVDKLLQYIPGTAVGAATMLTGHGVAAAAVVGTLAKYIGKDIPDAIRLSLLKFLGSSQKVDSNGFRAMVEFMHHTVKGENTLSKATKNIFKAGSEVIPVSQFPTDKDRKQIKKAVEETSNDPAKLLNVAGKTGHYMPDHTTALTQTAANAMKFLYSQRPNLDKVSPLDTQREATPLEKAQYNRALDIAQQPLIVLQHIADGKLTPQDVNIQKTLYPALYQRTVQKLTDSMSEAVAKGTVVPYKTKMMLSLYMGQALDSTMQPASILAAQPKPPMNQPQTATQPASNPKRSTNSLNKLPNMYRTPAQAAAEDRQKRE